MKNALLFVDIDMTVCDTSAQDCFLPEIPNGESSFMNWEEMIAKIDHPPHAAGVEEVMRLSEQHGKTVFLTGRSVRLAAATKAWMARHLPELSKNEYSFRPVGDIMSTVDSKIRRIRAICRAYGYQRATIIDDDERLEEPVLSIGHNFRRAP